MTSVGIAVTTTYLYDVNNERIAEGTNGATTTYPFPFLAPYFPDSHALGTRRFTPEAGARSER
jgi:hypothetical protein